ncbi:MAG TPA: hypothetical protein VJZ68_01460 [Nitrososphaera sp.]|nr:hypothetical protein [Nitrososphaera sp.]
MATDEARDEEYKAIEGYLAGGIDVVCVGRSNIDMVIYAKPKVQIGSATIATIIVLSCSRRIAPANEVMTRKISSNIMPDHVDSGCPPGKTYAM